MRRLMLVASLLLTAVGACSDGDAAPPPTTIASGLRGKLLLVGDLPDAFKSVSVTERVPAPASNNEYCAELDQHQHDFPGQRVAEVQFRREKGTATIFVNEIVTRYADVAQAGRAFEDFEKALDQCSQVTKRDTTGSLAGTFEPVEFVEVGDDTYATTFSATQTVEEDSASISGHFVAFRAQRYVVLLSALGSVDSLEQREVEAIAKKAVARL